MIYPENKGATVRQKYGRKKKTLLSIENDAYINGFRAAVRGLSKNSNPHKNVWLDKKRHEWWHLGWMDYQQNEIPWIIAKILRLEMGKPEAIKLEWQFKKTGKLPREIKELLKRI